MPRTIQDLSPYEIDHILQDAPKKCYRLIASDYDIPVHTVKKIVRWNGRGGI